MKYLLSALLFLLFISPSNAYKGLPNDNPTAAYLMDPIYLPDVTSWTVPVAVYAGPSEKEISMMARLDRQEVRLHNLCDIIDSMALSLAHQEKTIQNIERSEAERHAQFKKEKVRRTSAESNL